MKTKKIILTKELPCNPVGTKLHVYEIRDGRGLVVSVQIGKDITTIPLSKLEGWYEWVRYKPEVGEAYYYINGRGVVSKDVWGNNSFDRDLHTINNIFPCTDDGKAEAEAMVEKMIQLLKGER